MALVGYKNDKECDLSVEKWKMIYEELMGGFDDINDEEESEEETSEEE